MDYVMVGWNEIGIISSSGDEWPPICSWSAPTRRSQIQSLVRHVQILIAWEFVYAWLALLIETLYYILRNIRRPRDVNRFFIVPICRSVSMKEQPGGCYEQCLSDMDLRPLRIIYTRCFTVHRTKDRWYLLSDVKRLSDLAIRYC
jgi:hypothetical protein